MKAQARRLAGPSWILSNIEKTVIDPSSACSGPMRLFALGIELRELVPIQRPYNADPSSIVGPPLSATRSKASMAARHSGAA